MSQVFDYLVVGSGASGATVALTLSEAGQRVGVLEEGKWFHQKEFRTDMFSAIYRLFREQGMQLARGRAVMPILQGRCVGGSTVINGAIVHELPEKIFEQWQSDHFFSDWSYSEIDRASDWLHQNLQTGRNAQQKLKEVPLSSVLSQKGWSFEAMNRNAPGCQLSGHCLQGCPTGGKWSMERSFLPKAQALGADICSETPIRRVGVRRGRAWAESDIGEVYWAEKGIFLAAGVIQTPQILKRSGFDPVGLGNGFQAHLSVAVTAILDRPTRDIEGPPQGVEIQQFSSQGIKLATQLLPKEMLLARTPLVGEELAQYMKDSERITSWMASIKSESVGEVRFDLSGKAYVHFEPTAFDLERLRTSLCYLGELLFDLGAREIFPGVTVANEQLGRIVDRQQVSKLKQIPLDPRYYLMTLGHLFGGTLPGQCIVDSNLSLEGANQIKVVDAGIFPTNIGVNPQHSIMSLARVAANRELFAAV